MENLLDKKVNGFVIEDITSTIKAIQESPSIAKFEFRVRNKWISAGHNQATVKDFYGGGQEDESREKAWVFDNGEPPILLGKNEGANPVEYLLSALSGCMTTTIALHAAANGIHIDSIESKFEGHLDVQGFLGLNEQIRNGYQDIRVNFKIKGDLSEEQEKQLLDFAYKSPVFDVVTNKVPVEVNVSLN
ncbi:MAG: OsmC family protein [Bacteroidota bacterium]